MEESAKFTLKSIVTFLLLALLCSPFSSAYAKRVGWIGKMIEYNQYLSEKIDQLAENIDLFLSRRKFTDDINESTITLKSFASHQEGGDQDSSFNFDINLRLPNLEERWQLRFTSYDPSREERDVRSRRQRLQPREVSYGAGLALLQELGNVKTTFQPRIELRDPLQTSYTLRFESAGDVKPLSIEPRFELFADSEMGTGQFLSLNTELSLREGISIYQFNEEQYEDADNKFTTTHGISISKDVGLRRSVSTTFSFRSTSRPSAFHLSDFTASLGYASEPYRRVLAYNIGPHWVFAKDARFKGKVGFSFEIQLIF